MPTDDPWHKSRTRSQRDGHRSPPPVSGAEAAPVPAARRELRPREQRLFGINACLAVFASRRAAIRKVYLLEALMPRMRAVLAWCASERVGYRLVAADDLRKLTGSEHHEGVCFDTVSAAEHELDSFLPALAATPHSWLAWLEGVGNPHNFGAILRSAAHFGCAGVLLSRDSPLALSGAAARVAEGGAESVPIVRFDSTTTALAALRRQRYQSIASVVRGGDSLFDAHLTPRVVLLMGAEGDGLAPAMAAGCDLRLAIPGSGAVESLNVSAAFAVFAARISAPA